MAGPQNFLQYNGFKVYLGAEPQQGPRILPILFDFTLQSTYNVDLLIAQTQDELEFVQCVWIDNRLNAEPLIFTVGGDSQQILECPPYSQGYFPVLMNNPPRFSVTCVSGTANTPVTLMSCPVPAAVWNVQSIMTPYAPGTSIEMYSTGGTPLTVAATSTIFSAASNLRNYLTGFQVTNSSASGTEIQIKDGVSTVLWDGYANGNSSTCYQFEVPLRGSLSTTMYLRVFTSGASLWASAQGFTAA